jgi:hypothetical protein
LRWAGEAPAGEVNVPSSKQLGVAVGMFIGLALTVAGFVSPRFWSGFPRAPADVQGLLTLWAATSLVVAFWVFVSIARLARHRFFSPQDIDGGASNEGSERARLQQSVLQNTLEQAFLAVVAYAAWLFLAEPFWRALPVLFAAYFSVGRFLFFAGYAHGAPARALGFALTFYPTVGLILLILPAAALDILGLL